MKQLYFIRHGQSEMNVSGHYAGQLDTPLTALGRKQAKAAAAQAKKLPIDAIVSSPLSRALETAQIIAHEIGYPIETIHTSSLLMERHFGELQGQPYIADLDLDGFADVESIDEIIERARSAMRWLESLDADTILVASHGTFGSAMRSLHVPDADFFDELSNAEIMRLL